MVRSRTCTLLLVGVLLAAWTAPAAAAPVRLVVAGQEVVPDVPPVLSGGRVLVPLRGVFEALGATVQWDPAQGAVIARRAGREVVLAPGSREARVDGRPVPLDEPARVVGGRVLVPLRFLGEALGADVRWDPGTATVYVDPEGMPPALRLAVEERSVRLRDRTVTVKVLRLPRDAPLRPVVVLAQDRVGGLEELASMARRHGAVLAVNGTFFNPRDYAQRNNLPTEPWGTLIRGGKVLHVGNTGATVGFDGLSNVRIAPLRIRVEGATDGSWKWPKNWFAYGFNRTPAGPGASAVFIYTPERGRTVGFAYGTKVVVRQGRVVQVVENKDVEIPRDGYVIALVGADGDQLRPRFSVGTYVEYRVAFEDDRGNPLDWPYPESLGAGPLVVQDGRLRTDYAAQGFTEDKILALRGRRTGLGILPDGDLLIVLADALQVRELGEVFLALGARHAMNLDGGASSGLWLNGSYVVRPGRELSNALVFVPAGR